MDAFILTRPRSPARSTVSDRRARSEIGVSTFTASQVAAFQAHREAPLRTTQPAMSVVHLAPLFDGTLDQCLERGITPPAWSPLAGGRVATGIGIPPDLVAVLDRLAEREGVDRAAIAMAFVLAHPSRPVAITGTMNPQRIAQSAAAARVHLDRSDCYEAAPGEPMP
jgi:predicted oxidoreductase